MPRQTGAQAQVRPATATPAPAASGTAPPAMTPAPEIAMPQVGTGPVGPLPAGLGTGPFPAPADPLLGQTLAGRYHIQRKLGEGGMGAVYLAVHTALEKQVALKVLHNEFARKPDLVERFMQEARAASRIRHENVIDISDFGSTPEGFVFFAMELLSGHDLHEEIARARLAGAPLPWERSRRIFLQVCAALSAAHAQGIVHRDLKPENIYLIEFLGHKDFVKLLDFGIAKLTEVSEGDRKLTRTGMLFGTPEYMSPEQARGDQVDHRVDIYAMGCILYQLVVGRVPFEAENFMGILSQHLTEEPPPIAPAQLARIGAPPELAGIIMRALAKHRDERWPTIDDMANAIRALSGEAEQPVGEVKVPRAQSAVAQVPAGSARNRTQWTGSLRVPVEEVVTAPPRRSAAPWIAAGAILVAGGAIAAYVLTRHPSPAAPVAPGSAATPGSAAVAPGSAQVAPGSAAVPAPGSAATQEPPPAPVPAEVALHLVSTPKKAVVFELGASEVRLGTTPLDLSIPGGHAARRYAVRLKGYQDKIVELTPDHTPIEYTAALVKGSGTGQVEVVGAGRNGSHGDPGHGVKPGDGGKSTEPGAQTSTGGTTTEPAGTSTETPPEQKPPDVKPPDEPGDPDLIELKPPEARGSGSP